MHKIYSLYDSDTIISMPNVLFPYSCDNLIRNNCKIYFDGDIPYTEVIYSNSNSINEYYCYALLFNKEIIAIGEANNRRDSFLKLFSDKDFFKIKKLLKNSKNSEKIKLYNRIKDIDLLTNYKVLPKKPTTLFTKIDNNGDKWYITEEENKAFSLWKCNNFNGEMQYITTADTKDIIFNEYKKHFNKK